MTTHPAAPHRLATSSAGDASVSAADAADAREREAVRASIAPLLSPSGIIVAGATRRPGSVGRMVLTNLLKRGYGGRIAVVNRHASNGEQIGGVPAYRTAADVPWRADLAVISVPAGQVAPVLDGCGEAGVAGAVILSSGFAEAGNTAGQAALTGLAQRHGMRLIGPNCLGLLNTDPAVRMDAAFAGAGPLAGERGGIGLAAQSGAVGIAMLDMARERGASMASFISLGNAADVGADDMLLYWEDDARTQVIALYVESIGDSRRFRRIARRIAMTKPIVVLRSGRSLAEARTGASHTAAAATPDAVATALFSDAGVISTDTTEELMDVAMLLGAQPVPCGRRIAIVGNAGGPGGLAADAAQRAGVDVPVLSRTTMDLLLAAVPSAAAVGNPVDLGATSSPDDYEAALTILAASGEVDSIVAVHVVVGTNEEHDVINAVAGFERRSRQRTPSGPPPVTLAGVLIGAPAPRGTKLPWYGHAESAARAVARAGGLGAWRDEQAAADPAEQPGLTDIDVTAVLTLLELSERSADGWLDPAAATALMELAGVPVVTTRRVNGFSAAVFASCEFPGPTVLKTAAPGFLHKTDAGAVIVGLNDPADVAQAAEEIQAATGSDAFVVQPVVGGDLELLAGLDSPSGGVAVAMIAAGGVHETVMADRALATLPLTPGAAGRMIGQLRCSSLLAGHRGSPVLDRAGVTLVLERISALAMIAPQIRELDINPLMVSQHGVMAADVRVRVAATNEVPVSLESGHLLHITHA